MNQGSNQKNDYMITKILRVDTVPMDQQGYEARGVLRVLDSMQKNGDGKQCRNIAERTKQFNPFFTGEFVENLALGCWEYIYQSNQ